MTENNEAPTVCAIEAPQHELMMSESCDAAAKQQDGQATTRVSVRRVLMEWNHANDEQISADDFDRLVEVAVGRLRRRT